MGWADAPLASPAGPKPAWASAPVAAPPPDDGPTVGGFLSRVRARVQQSVGSLAGGIDQVGSDAAHAVGLNGTADWFKHDQSGADQDVNKAQTVLATTPTVSSDAHPILGPAAHFGEQALGMIPDVVLATNPVGLAAYAAGTEGDTARRRAENDKRTDPTIMDYLAAAPSSAANVALQKFGVGGKGVGLLQRLGREGAAQGGISGADYVGTTAGTQTPFSVPDLAERTGEGAVTGLVLGGGMHLTHAGLAELHARYAAKGVDTSGLSDEQLTEGTLNGSIHPDVGPADVNEILKSQGVPPSSVSPDKAQTFADRIVAARARPNVNDLGAAELKRQQGVAEDVAAGNTDPAWMSAPIARTPGPDVTMQAAPEGIIPSDDTGAQAGVDRHRAASENVLATAQQHAERDPVIKEILDSSLSPDTKVGVLLDRLHKYIDSLPDAPEHPAFPTSEAPTPFQEPTAAAAASHPIMPATQLERELAVTQHTESHDDPNAVSPKGARGAMQTMPGTLRDPGYGVRPAANDSPDEMRRVGRDYYSALRDHYGTPEKAWAAYNAGPGALDGAVKKYGADWLEHMPQETRDYVSKNMAAIGAAPTETVYRGPAPTDEPFRSDSGFERTGAPEAPLERTGLGDSFTATGDSSRPFMEETDTPAGEEPGFWERRAEMHADDLRKEWESSRQEPPSASADPSQKYGANNYGQRPHMPDGSDSFAMTPEGHIADVNGKPVAFRNVKDAATFAAKNKLGGDFEPQVWATNSTRVVLTKRTSSSYGEARPTPEGPAEPAAGRSTDQSQRMIPDAMKPPVEPAGEPPARETGPTATGEPEAPPSAPAPVSRAPEPPLRAERWSVSDQQVPRGTENLPEKDVPTPRTFFQAVRDHLDDRQAKSGVRTRLSAEDAISNGVQPDSIYIDPKAKYPRLKIWANRVFANERGPLRTKAQPTNIVSLDHLGDVMDPERFGVPSGDGVQDHRLAPEHAGALLQHSMDGNPEGWDQHDPNYARYHEALQRGEDQDRLEMERDALHEVAARHGVELSDNDVEAALHHRAAGETHENAIEAALREADAKVLDQGADETGNEFYRSVANDVHEGGAPEEGSAGTGEAGERSQGEPGNADRSGAGSEEPSGVNGARARSGGDNRPQHGAGDELIPGRETDQRDALQRRADDRLKASAEQKSAGSDGGLFDTQDTTGDLYGDSNKFVTREAKDRASAKISEASKRANAGVDPEAIGALGTEAAFHVEASARKLASMVMEPDANPAELIHAAKDLVSHPKQTATGLLKGLDKFGAAWAYSSDGELRTYARHFDAPTIAKVADMFQARRGAGDSTDRTYNEAVKRNIGRFVNDRLLRTMDPFIGKKASVERIRDMLAEPGRTVRATDGERTAAREIRKLLDDVMAYRREAGEDIGEVKNYFPRVVDALAVADNSAKFLKAAERLYSDVGADDPRAAAEAWMTRIMDTHAGLDGGEEFVKASGKPSSSKSREFTDKADTLLRDFYQKDASIVLHDYLMGSIRRAEQARRFGPKGAVDSKERGEWMREHGTKTQRQVLIDQVRDEVRARGDAAHGIPDRVGKIIDTNLGRLSGFDVRVSSAVAKLHAWNQLAHLERVTLSSLGDAAMGYTRFGGKVGTQHLLGTIKESTRLIQTLGKRDPSDARRWAEDFGVVGHTSASALISARLDMNPNIARHAGVLDKFYHKVGIEQWTQGGRTQAAQNGKVFLNSLANDLMSGSARTRQRAGFYLKEVGIKDPQAFGEWLRRGTPSKAELAADRGHAADYATAVIRLSDDTVLMPNRAQKPAWANHPVGSLIFALQSYNAAFTQNVLKRVGRLGVEAFKQKDAKLLGPAFGLIPLLAVTAAQNWMRTAIFGGAPTKPDSTTQWALTILDRAGLTGTASPIFNAFGGLRYHRSTGAAVEGSILGSGVQAADAIGGLFLGNSPNTNTAERKVAGLVYDLAVNPAENFVGAKYIRGAAGTAAIMGTGNKKGGVLPGDRDAFIDAVAGPGKT